MAFDDQNAEMEQHYDQMIAQVAVSRMYTLAVSVDVGRTEYHCVHYAEKSMEFRRNGSFADYTAQLGSVSMRRTGKSWKASTGRRATGTEGGWKANCACGIRDTSFTTIRIIQRS